MEQELNGMKMQRETRREEPQTSRLQYAEPTRTSKLNIEVVKDIEKRRRMLRVIKDYETEQLDNKMLITAVERMDNLSIEEAGLNVNNALIMECRDFDNTYYRVVKEQSKVTTIDVKDVDRLAKELNLERTDIEEFLKMGASLKDIEEIGKDLQARLELSKAELADKIIVTKGDNKLKNQTISLDKTVDGKIQISKLDEIMKIDENGNVELSEDYQEKLQKLGIDIDPNEKMFLEKEISSMVNTKDIESKYKVINGKQMEKEQSKEDEEREKIADSLGEDKNNVLCAMRINDKETFSQIADTRIAPDGTTVLLVRLANNNFKLVRENDDKSLTELKGYDITPVAKHIAPLLKDKVGNLYSNFNAGDAITGKSIEGQRKYDMYQIRAAGESNDDGANTLLYVNASGKERMELIKNVDEGYELEIGDAEPQFPSAAVIGGKKKEFKDVELEEEVKEEYLEEPRTSNNFSGSYKSELKMLEELTRIESEIWALENEPDLDLGSMVKGAAAGLGTTAISGSELAGVGVGAAVAGKSHKEHETYKNERINGLSAERDRIVAKLGYKSAEQALEEAEEMMRGMRRTY